MNSEGEISSGLIGYENSLSSWSACEYFVDSLSKGITQKGRFHLELSEEKFADVADLIRLVLTRMASVEMQLVSPESFLNVL